MRSRAKKLHKIAEEAIQIRCRYCDIRKTCEKREQKEKLENKGWITKCTLTPNRPGKKKKKKQ